MRKGSHHSKETKIKISTSKIGMHRTPESRIKQSISTMGHKNNDKTCRTKISEALRKRWKSPGYRDTKIKNALEQWRKPGALERASKIQKECWANPAIRIKLFGPDHPLWRGGSSRYRHYPGFNEELKNTIRKRDDFICQNPDCYIPENGHIHSVHHINYNKSDHSKQNLITLCVSCHSKTTTGDRNYWQEYYKNVQEMRGITNGSTAKDNNL